MCKTSNNLYMDFTVPSPAPSHVGLSLDVPTHFVKRSWRIVGFACSRTRLSRESIVLSMVINLAIHFSWNSTSTSWFKSSLPLHGANQCRVESRRVVSRRGPRGPTGLVGPYGPRGPMWAHMDPYVICILFLFDFVCVFVWFYIIVCLSLFIF